MKSAISFPAIWSCTVHICLARYLFFFRFLFLYFFLFLFFSILLLQVTELRVNCIHPSKNSLQLVNAGNYLYGRGGEKNSFILEETGLFREISMTNHFYRPFLRSWRKKSTNSGLGVKKYRVICETIQSILDLVWLYVLRLEPRAFPHENGRGDLGDEVVNWMHKKIFLPDPRCV